MSAHSRQVDVSYHHSSHRHLLTKVLVEEAPKAEVDAVIVPTARPVQWLREAVNLAGGLGCRLFVLCSKSIKAAEAVELGADEKVSTVALDVPAGHCGLPDMTTSRFVDGSGFRRNNDTSKKRNLALVLSRAAGWKRVLFVDDDIFDLQPSDARAAAGLLTSGGPHGLDSRYRAVGLNNAGYPDNSVVCHVNREVGGRQDQFVGAGALAISPRLTRSFFPDIYNEDWLFFLGGGLPLRIAVTGKMRQKRYDPFADPCRARREEFGDCLAEGLFKLLDDTRSPVEAEIAYWRDFLTRRRRFQEHLLKSVPGTKEGRRWRASLEEADRTRGQIRPSMCTEYLALWRADLQSWQRFLKDHPVGGGFEKALAQLGLLSFTHTSW